MSFFNSLKNIFSFGSKRALGLDIGTTTVKIVELAVDKLNRISLSNYGFLENYGHLERINDAFQTSGLKLMETDVSLAIRKIFDKSEFKTKAVGMTIPIYSAFVSTLEFPKMPDNDLAKAIPYTAKQIVPMPLSDIVLDWTEVVPSKEEILFRNLDKKIIFLVAVSKEVIERYKRIAKLANLNLVSLELEGLSQGRALLGNDKTPTFVLDIGSRVTNLMIFDNGYLRVSKFFDLASGDISQAISRGLKVDIWRAEKIKKEQGLSASQAQMEVVNLIYPTIDAIVRESENLIKAYKGKTGREIKNFFLAGATANMPGLVDYLSSQFKGVSVSLANAFARVNYSPEAEPVIRIISPSSAASVGSAIRILSS